MASIDDVKGSLRNACVKLIEAGTGSIIAAMATAGLANPRDLPEGMEMPKKNLGDAGALASQAAQTMNAVYDCAHALAELEQQFPTAPASPTP